MRCIIIPVAILCAAAGCRSHRAATTAEAVRTEVRSIQRFDSAVRLIVTTADSPEVVIEWPDSPRCRMIARARRVTAAAATERVRVVTVHDTVTQNVTAHTRAETDSRPTPFMPWIIAITATAALIVTLCKKR